MKSIFRTLFHLTLIFSFLTPFTVLKAQSAGFFNYQAVVSNPDGNPYEGTVGLKISILQPSADGDVVYSERHTKESNENGFISFRVGEGEQVYRGEFDTINWSSAPSFIKTEIAPGGGYSYPISSTTELVSVPLALYALTADSIASNFTEEDPVFKASVASMITPEDTARWNALSKKVQFHVGDFHEGGIIFYIEPDGEHGMIASLSDITEGVQWGSMSLATDANSNYDGSGNSEIIVTATGAGDYAAYYCDTLSMNGYDDWYLPSADEMFLLFRSRYLVNKVIEEDDNVNTTILKAGGYWTSTEREISTAYLFVNGNLNFESKDQPANVRAIREF